MPPETLEQLKVKVVNSWLKQTRLVEMMKEDYHYLKAAQDSHEYLDPEDQKCSKFSRVIWYKMYLQPKAGQVNEVA